MRTHSTLPPAWPYSMPIVPAGTSIVSRPGVRGTTRPCSRAKVTMPIVPWPHMGRQPLVSMKTRPQSASSDAGG